jgi:hypothetical protein
LKDSKSKENEKVKQRELPRVPVGAAAEFTWGESKGDKKRGKGVTRDISAKGLYLETETPPPVGSSIKLDVVLPRVRGMLKNLRMKAMGRVVRVQPPQEEDDPISGFAAITDRFILQEPSESKQTKESSKTRRKQ